MQRQEDMTPSGSNMAGANGFFLGGGWKIKDGNPVRGEAGQEGEMM